MKRDQIARLDTRANVEGSASLAMMPTLDMVADQRASLWFESFCLAAALPAFVKNGPGTLESTRWTWLPEGGEEGTYRLRLRAAGGMVSPRLVVRPALAAPAQTLKIHVIGDSFSAAAVPANWMEYVDDLLIAAGVTATWLGTQQAVGQSAHIFHEGYGGSSFLWWTGRPGNLSGQGPYIVGNELNPAAYGEAAFPGETPDVVMCILGTNSYGTVNLGNQAEWDAIYAQRAELFDAILAAWPNAWLCPALAMPLRGEHPLNDDPRKRRDIYLRNTLADLRARIVRGQRVAIPPILACIDPVNGFPSGNDHFDESGSIELASALYCFLRRFVP